MRSFRGWRNAILGMAVGGTCFQLGCITSGVTALFRGFNPCGVIFACDPADYALATSGFDIRDPELLSSDPFCTIPPLCDEAIDPIFGGAGNP
jgi:hypothetical protein